MVDKETSIESRQELSEILLKILEYEPSVGLWVKFSLLSRKVFLAFKHYSKAGKVKHLRHVNHGDFVSDHFVRRICSRRIGKQLESLSFEFSALTDDHLSRA